MKKITTKDSKNLEDYLTMVEATTPVNADEEYELLTRIRNYDEEAKVELYNGYLKYVVYVSKAINNNEFPLLDIIDVGNNAVDFAIDTFVLAKGSRALFKNYITWLIDKNIKESIRLKRALKNGK